MRIGYFGGSFDPPHRGHLAVAKAARTGLLLERVLLAPTGSQPLKPDGPTASFADRLRMTELLCAEDPGLEASAVDAPQHHGKPNYTSDTLRGLRATLPPAAEIFAIVGADAFLSLPQWHDLEGLMGLAQWIVVSRPGTSPSALDAVAEGLPGRPEIQFLNDVADPVSATELRSRLRAHLPCEALLPAAVVGYIRQHGLYGA